MNDPQIMQFDFPANRVNRDLAGLWRQFLFSTIALKTANRTKAAMCSRLAVSPPQFR